MKKIVTSIALLLLASFVSEAQIPSYVPSNGLVGWWPFNGNSTDESGNGYNGIVKGCVLTNDRFGVSNAAYWFDSTFIEVSNSSNLNFSNISINLWYLNKNVRYGDFISKHQSGSYNSSFLLWNEGSIGCGPQWYTTSPGNNVATIWKSGFCDTTSWHMLTGIYSNGIMSLYIDGVYYSSSNQSSIKATSLPIIIGGTNITPTIAVSDSKMKLDDIGIWNRALDSAEVSNLHNATSTGIQSLTNSHLVLFPNPATNEITISNPSAPQDYSILSINGQLLKSGNLATGTQTIDIAEFANGIYLLKTTTATYKFSVVH